MTEQDVFDALRRDPFRQVLVKCFDRAELGRDLFTGCQDIIYSAGWTLTELEEILSSEMDKKNIKLNITSIRDANAQKNFLLTGKI
jgi:hypothetical protein